MDIYGMTLIQNIWKNYKSNIINKVKKKIKTSDLDYKYSNIACTSNRQTNFGNIITIYWINDNQKKALGKQTCKLILSLLLK